VSKIQAAALEGKPIRELARDLGVARNTVRKYLRGAPRAHERPRRGSQLDPYKDQIRVWVERDHLVNCETIVERLRERGYTGGKTIVKDFVHPLRPARRGQAPVIRYETPPGTQMQVDWGEFVYEQDGVRRKVYGLAIVLGYSRVRHVTFMRRCDAPSLIRGLLAAWTYCGGLPELVLTDRMKTVLLALDGPTPQWHPLFADFLATVGVVPKVCKAYTPQTKGKVERAVGVIKADFWPGVTFTDLADLNRQAQAWCDRRNRRVNRTTHQRPVDRLPAEGLRPLPAASVTGSVRIRNANGRWRASAYGGPGLLSPMPPATSRTPHPSGPGTGGAARPRTPSHSCADGSAGDRAIRHGRSRSGLPRQRSQSRAWGNSAA